MNKTIIPILVMILLVQAANAFTTNGTEKTFDFAVTSSTAQTKSGNFTTFIVAGTVSSSDLSSTNFKTELGFQRTTGYVVGEACGNNLQCASRTCCDGLCQTSCPSAPAPPTPHTSSAGSTSGLPTPEPIPSNASLYFFDAINANEEIILNIDKEGLAIIRIALKVNQKLEAVSLSVVPVENPSLTINNAYQYIEIKSNKINSNNLASLVIHFRVRIDSGYIKETVSLNKLPTALISEDNLFYYYESATQDLGLFAITGEKSVLIPTATPVEEPHIAVQEEELQVAVPEIKEEAAAFGLGRREKPKRAILITISGILLIASLALFMLAFRNFKFMYLQNIYTKFYELSSDAAFYLSKHNVAKAIDLYRQSLEDYKYLIKYPISKREKIQIYKKIRNLYNEIAASYRAEK